jgi:hypothetical protein
MPACRGPGARAHARLPRAFGPRLAYSFTAPSESELSSVALNSPAVRLRRTGGHREMSS